MAGGAHHGAVGGERGRPHGPGDPEVDQARAIGGQQDVRRLHVPVDEPGRVHVVQGLGECGTEGDEMPLAPGPLARDGLGEGGPRDVGGGQPRGSRLGVGREHRHGPPPAEPGRELRLPPEARAEPGIGSVLAADHLERAPASVRGCAR